MPKDSELVQAIVVLARAQQDAVWERQQQSNRIRSLLREYYPTILRAFPNSADLARPAARALLNAAPTPSKAARLTRSQIRRILVKAGRTRNLEAATDDLHPILREPGLRQLPAVEAAFGKQLEALLLQFDATCQSLESLTQRLRKCSTPTRTRRSSPAFPGSRHCRRTDPGRDRGRPHKICHCVGAESLRRRGTRHPGQRQKLHRPGQTGQEQPAGSRRLHLGLLGID